jgi:hypothetical protein
VKYDVEMASDGMIYLPCFEKFGSDALKKLLGKYTYRNTQGGDFLSLLKRREEDQNY